MKLYLIRHGDPDYDKDSLTEEGRRQAHALACLPWVRSEGEFFSSPLGRARETAAPAAEAAGKAVEILPWLREMDDVTVWDRRRPDLAVWNLAPERLKTLENRRFLEDAVMAETCLKKRWEELESGGLSLLSRYGISRRDGAWREDGPLEDRYIALFCHLGVGLTFLAFLLDLPPAVLWRTGFLSPSSVTEILAEESGDGRVNFRILKMSGVEHLALKGIEAGTRGLQYNFK